MCLAKIFIYFQPFRNISNTEVMLQKTFFILIFISFFVLLTFPKTAKRSSFSILKKPLISSNFTFFQNSTVEKSTKNNDSFMGFFYNFFSLFIYPKLLMPMHVSPTTPNLVDSHLTNNFVGAHMLHVSKNEFDKISRTKISKIKKESNQLLRKCKDNKTTTNYDAVLKGIYAHGASNNANRISANRNHKKKQFSSAKSNIKRFLDFIDNPISSKKSINTVKLNRKINDIFEIITLENFSTHHANPRVVARKKKIKKAVISTHQSKFSFKDFDNRKSIKKKFKIIATNGKFKMNVPVNTKFARFNETNSHENKLLIRKPRSSNNGFNHNSNVKINKAQGEIDSYADDIKSNQLREEYDYNGNEDLKITSLPTEL